MGHRVKAIQGMMLGVVLCLFAGVETSVASAAAAEPSQPGTVLDKVELRTGEHPTFSRMVFDWKSPVKYTVEHGDEQFEVHFERKAELDPAAVKGRLSRISEPRLKTDGPGLIIVFRKTSGTTIRHFRDGTNVVIDVVAGTAPIATPPTATPKTPEKAAPVPQTPEIKPPTPAIAAAGDKAKAEQPKPATADVKSAAQSGRTVAMQYEPIFNGLRLSYPLGDAMPSAVFTRAGQLWVVFDTSHSVDHAALNGVLGDRIKSAEQIPNPLATVLRYGIRDGQYVVAHRRDGTWIVELKDNRTAPQLPLDIAQQKGLQGSNIFVPAADVGGRVILQDPVVGDQITAMPLLAPGRGMIEERNFTEFTLLQTAQGIVIQPLADSLQVDSFRNGVSISTPKGLALSAGLPEVVAEADVADAVPDRPQRLIDLVAWKRGGPGDYQVARQTLLNRLSLAQDEEKNSARWDLARFYLGHGLADQAIGILDIMAAGNADLLENPEFRAARGIAHVLLRRYTAARNDFAHPELDTEADAYLWRSLAAAGMDDPQKALEFYKRGLDVLADYEEADRARFKLAAVRSALATGDHKLAEDELALLSGYLLPASVGSELDYLRGRLLTANADYETAKDVFGKVIEGGNRQSAAKATLQQIALKLTDKSLAPADAIDQMERLRYAWRGDGFELDLLERLGALYMDTGEFRTGLNTLRQAVTYFDNTARTREVSEIMSAAFRKLFLDGEADAMPPVQALSLYYDFRELTPLGADGDNMIRRLADRLVAVDLLDRAGELLEHQVRYRLEGVAQATVASRLAMIYLMNQKPEKALAVIRATRQAVMPDDITLRRRLLEARALIDLKQYEEAEVLIEKDKNPEADMLRADLYWGSSRWADVVKNGTERMGGRWQANKSLTDDERRQVLRIAVAMSLDENISGLRTLRDQYGALMTNGAYAGAFEAITAKQDPSSKEIKELTEGIASVHKLESFMAAYRQEFRGS